MTWMVAIETSGDIGSAAVARDGVPVQERTFERGPRHARDLMPAIADMLREAGLSRSDISLVGVSQGPGSFTGLRIGAACAKTLAWSLGWALVGVPSLEIIAQNAGERQGYVCPLIDARRKCVYAAVFARKQGKWRPETDILVGGPEEVAAKLPEGALVFGDAVESYPDLFAAPRFAVGDKSLIIGKARHAASLAYERFLAGVRNDPLLLVPQYYRATEAEENLARKT